MLAQLLWLWAIPAKSTSPEFRIMAVKIGKTTSNTVACENFRNTLFKRLIVACENAHLPNQSVFKNPFHSRSSRGGEAQTEG
jgi:hypothetical protein